jgi:hypothetical protein
MDIIEGGGSILLPGRSVTVNLFGLNSPLPWGESWLKANGLKSVINARPLAAGCLIHSKMPACSATFCNSTSVLNVL